MDVSGINVTLRDFVSESRLKVQFEYNTKTIQSIMSLPIQSDRPVAFGTASIILPDVKELALSKKKIAQVTGESSYSTASLSEDQHSFLSVDHKYFVIKFILSTFNNRGMPLKEETVGSTSLVMDEQLRARDTVMCVLPIRQWKEEKSEAAIVTPTRPSKITKNKNDHWKESFKRALKRVSVSKKSNFDTDGRISDIYNKEADMVLRQPHYICNDQATIRLNLKRIYTDGEPRTHKQYLENLRALSHDVLSTVPQQNPYHLNESNTKSAIPDTHHNQNNSNEMNDSGSIFESVSQYVFPIGGGCCGTTEIYNEQHDPVLRNVDSYDEVTEDSRFTGSEANYDWNSGYYDEVSMLSDPTFTSN